MPKPWVGSRLLLFSSGGRDPFPFPAPGAKGCEVQEGCEEDITKCEVRSAKAWMREAGGPREAEGGSRVLITAPRSRKCHLDKAW